MTQFLRGKQAGVQRDFSAGLDPSLFALDEVPLLRLSISQFIFTANLEQLVRYGINSQIGALAYDPVQSLLAVGTNDTQFGPGQVYVFGQTRVSVTFPLPRTASVRTVQFSADKLVALDSRNEISCFSLETTRIVSSYAPPGGVTAILTDPALDYALIGLQNGL